MEKEQMNATVTKTEQETDKKCPSCGDMMEAYETFWDCENCGEFIVKSPLKRPKSKTVTG